MRIAICASNAPCLLLGPEWEQLTSVRQFSVDKQLKLDKLFSAAPWCKAL